MDGVYKGVGLRELRINAVSWTEERAEHLRRSRRNPDERDIECEWATEAALDPSRVVVVAGAGESASLKVVGWSDGALILLKVWIWSDDPTRDEWNGGSAAPANGTDEKRYREANG